MKSFLQILANLFLITSTNTFAQEIEWQKTIGGTAGDRITNVIKLNDGFILGGASGSGISGDKTNPNIGSDDFWILKTDFNGNLLWQKTIGSLGFDDVTSIIKTPDNGLLCGCYTDAGIGGSKTENSRGSYDYWIIKLDSIGNIQWQKTIGGNNGDYLYSLSSSADNGYFIGGYSASSLSADKTEPNFGFSDYWVIKLDSAGNMLWQKSIGGTDFDFLTCVRGTADGGCLCGGASESAISGNKTSVNLGSEDIWAVKLDNFGNIQWQKTIGGIGVDRLSTMEIANDGGYILSCTSTSPISFDKIFPQYGADDIWIIKLDTIGNIQWQFGIGGNSYDKINSISQLKNGDYIFSGGTSSTFSGTINENTNGNYEAVILKLDSFGALIWYNLLGGNNNDMFTSIFEIDTNSYFTAGFSYSNISGDKSENSKGNADFWVIKFEDIYSNKITGNVFADMNSNFNFDSTDSPVRNSNLREIQTNRITYSSQYGNYNFALKDTGHYDVSLNSNYNNFSASPINQPAYFSSFNQIDSLNNFAIQPVIQADDLCMTITPLGAFRPGFNGYYMLNYENVGTTTQIPKIVFRIFPNVSFVSASITPSAIYTDSVVWYLGSLSPLQIGQILVNVYLSPSIPIGTILNSYAQIFPIINDINPSCNNATWEVIVTGSFDPNDISVDQDTILFNTLSNSSYLNYIIRFQNTGNDTAFTVKIINPIDTLRLDLNSLEFVSSSHPLEMIFVYYSRNMEFTFNNILLPDSNTNEPESHGFIRYKVKPKQGLNIVDSIQNLAAIFFDFNDPVFTNIAMTKIVSLTGFQNLSTRSDLDIYPNPASNEINLEISNTRKKNVSINLYNVYGQKIKCLFQGNIITSEFKKRFEIGDLHQGMYLLEYRIDGISKSKKIIKL